MQLSRNPQMNYKIPFIEIRASPICFQVLKAANEQKTLSISFEKLEQNYISSSFRKFYLELESYENGTDSSCRSGMGKASRDSWLRIPYCSAS